MTCPDCVIPDDNPTLRNNSDLKTKQLRLKISVQDHKSMDTICDSFTNSC